MTKIINNFHPKPLLSEQLNFFFSAIWKAPVYQCHPKSDLHAMSPFPVQISKAMPNYHQQTWKPLTIFQLGRDRLTVKPALPLHQLKNTIRMYSFRA